MAWRIRLRLFTTSGPSTRRVQPSEPAAGVRSRSGRSSQSHGACTPGAYPGLPADIQSVSKAPTLWGGRFGRSRPPGDEEGDGGDENEDRGPDVEAQSQNVVGVIDPQGLHPYAAKGVAGHAQGQQPPVGQGEPLFRPDQQEVQT